ncbi:hypothetical protein AUR64_11980 [Haloprofundus marisrubri]|uniref:Uncharacterized protein n=1 Tax=Haloprofundus marisrubri TaxID=1514971 RepID=A0A0W1RB76_9EURY|nr:hypothetical protein [Haloprofundus marisrubri]KTG10290.1 hypothetical protein AUR64_11980 [Haloprofundus marisrubri]
MDSAVTVLAASAAPAAYASSAASAAVSQWSSAGLTLQLGPIETLVSTFGPFVIPVLIFVVGLVGYLVLVALGRAGLVNGR